MSPCINEELNVNIILRNNIFFPDAGAVCGSVQSLYENL